MARKVFIIDTNVLIHDRDALKQFHENDVVIPLAVLEELDSMKRNSDEIGKNVRYVLRYIDSLKAERGDLSQGVMIENGICIKIHMDLKLPEKRHFPFPLDRATHKILLTASIFKESGYRVVLVSKDFVTRVKAESIGVEAEDYENLKFSYEKLYKGIRKLNIPKSDLDLFLKNGQLSSHLENLSSNEYVQMTSGDEGKALGKMNGITQRIEPLLKLPKNIWGILPLNLEQKCAIDLLLRDDIHLVTLIGQAGTGKTLLALAAGLKKVFDEGIYTKILVSRPIMPLGKDIGYLPGTKEEKLYHWMQPIYDNLEFLSSSATSEKNGEDAKEWILESKKIEMEAVTYIRGRSLPKMYIIIDEAQNLTPHEVKTIISRAGKGTKVILTGDPSQIDNPYLDQDSNALTYVVGKMRGYPNYGHIFLEKTERSELAAIAADIL
ncbi:MAG: PhoH family protein [Candidatus Rhabdochlamydia sp.]